MYHVCICSKYAAYDTQMYDIDSEGLTELIHYSEYTGEHASRISFECFMSRSVYVLLRGFV